MPTELKAPCSALPEAESSAGPELFANHVEVAGIAHDCRDRHAALARAASEREAREWERYEAAKKAQGEPEPRWWEFWKDWW